MEDLIPIATRTHFFARRVRICQFCTMLGFVVGGLLLESGKRGGWLMPAFVAVFVVAALARFVSTALLASTSESPNVKIVTQGQVGLSEIRRRLGAHSGMRVLWFLFAMQASVQLSGPYFTPFMLGKLGMRYDQFMLLVVLGFLGKVVAMRTWGKVANRAGARTLLWIGGASIVPVSGAWIALWWIEEPMLYLCVVQFLGGVAWAAYELGFFLMFFEAIPRNERTSVLTIYNFGNAAALLVGAIFGAIWLAWQGETHHAFLVLFVLSSLARLFSLLLLRRIPRSHGSAASTPGAQRIRNPSSELRNTFEINS
jgi:MFS family permease